MVFSWTIFVTTQTILPHTCWCRKKISQQWKQRLCQVFPPYIVSSFQTVATSPSVYRGKKQHDPAPVSLTQLQRQVAKIERPTTDRSTTKIMPHSTWCNVKLSKRHACMTTIKTQLEVPPSVIRDYSYGLVNSEFPTFITWLVSQVSACHKSLKVKTPLGKTLRKITKLETEDNERLDVVLVKHCKSRCFVFKSVAIWYHVQPHSRYNQSSRWASLAGTWHV